MVSIRQAIVVVLAIGIAALVGGALVPVGIGEVVDDRKTTLTLDNNTATEVNGALDANLTDVNTSSSPNKATIDLITDDQTITNTIDVNATATYAFNEGDVDVGLESVSTGSPDQATANFTYPVEFAQSGGASSLWTNLDLFIVLGLLGVFVLAVREQF